MGKKKGILYCFPEHPAGLSPAQFSTNLKISLKTNIMLPKKQKKRYKEKHYLILSVAINIRTHILII